MSKVRARHALALLPLVAFGLGACGSDKVANPNTQCGGVGNPCPPPMTDMRGRKQVAVEAKDNQFKPPGIVIDAGTKVTWTNNDVSVHDVKKAADALDFGAPFGASTSEFGPGATYSFTFAKPGDFPYVCSIHAGMTGLVRVVAAGSTGASTLPGDG